MKTLVRTKLPEKVQYNGKTFVFLSPLDRVGSSAESAGYPVLCIQIDNDKRRQSRRMKRWTGNGLMKYDKPTEYFYISDTITPEQIKNIRR